MDDTSNDGQKKLSMFKRLANDDSMAQILERSMDKRNPNRKGSQEINLVNEPVMESQYEDEMKELIMNDSAIAQVELPKILMRKADQFRRSLASLQRDQYGDLILKSTDGDDEITQNVMKQGKNLQSWIGQMDRSQRSKEQNSRLNIRESQ